MNAIRNRLKTIYEQRSNIAHGNFRKLNDYIKRISQNEEEEYFDNLITDMYKYVKAVIQEYIKDRNFVEFLKDN